jgi:hypothetical protein
MDADRNNLPSALHASDQILKELHSKGVLISRFTLVGWIGKKLKLGVNNKDDYATLMSTDKWPTKINGIDIAVIKPKYNPDSFALVVRYVPRDLEEEFVANEIKRTISSAERIKRIHFAYQRKTDDYRFDVKDYQEYNSALQLGRIGIGHSWLSITPFFPGNRLTFCTKCWCIGHLRNKCNKAAKCRVCLEILTENHPQMCTSEPKCAQCDGKHHSLDNQCEIIRDYKNQLKEEVNNAIKSGKLQRIAPMTQDRNFELQEQDFPASKTTHNPPRKKWNTTQGHSTNEMIPINIPEIEKSLEDISNKLSKLVDSNQRVESKVNQLTAELKIVTLDTQLHQAVLTDVIEIMKDFVQKFLPALLTSNKDERMNLMPLAQQFYNRYYSASTRLNDGFQLNRKVSRTPSIVNQNILGPDKGSPVLSVSTAKSTSKMVNSSNNQSKSPQIIK